MNLIAKTGSINVNGLAERFGISRETIRRDLSDMERQGILRRTHGGAVLDAPASAPPATAESPVAERTIRQADEKRAICKKAASFLTQGDTIFIDNSSTMFYFPGCIPADMQLTVITNSVNFLYEAAKIPNYNWLMISLGGIFKPRNLSVYGSDSLKAAEPYYPSKVFISCAGISPVNKIADTSLQEIEVKRMLIERGQKVFLLADHTKFTKAGQMHLCGFESIDCIITDPAAGKSGEAQKILKNTGIELIVAD
jgi:DeoR family fructose operon transcriptional repressor